MWKWRAEPYPSCRANLANPTTEMLQEKLNDNTALCKEKTDHSYKKCLRRRATLDPRALQCGTQLPVAYYNFPTGPWKSGTLFNF